MTNSLRHVEVKFDGINHGDAPENGVWRGAEKLSGRSCITRRSVRKLGCKSDRALLQDAVF